jgi:hypothetical protein
MQAALEGERFREGLRAEERFLLACVAPAGPEAFVAEAARSNPELDWELVLRIARRHSLLPLLHRGASRLDFTPEPARRQLDAAFRDNAARNVFLVHELLRIVALLEGRGIAVLAYKGPLLALAAYGNLSLRRFVDLDLLVPRAQIAEAVDLLESQGYAGDITRRRAQLRFLLDTQNEFALSRDQGRLILELHWEIAGSRFAQETADAGVWSRRRAAVLSGQTVHTLAPEDLLLTLCVHGAKHTWERLAWVADIAWLLTATPGLDWFALLVRAREKAQLRMLLAGLALAQRCFDGELPANVCEAIQADPAIEALVVRARGVLFRDPETSPSILATLQFNLRARETTRTRVAYVRHLFTPTIADVNTLNLPPPLRFLYPLLRPFRMILKREHMH